MTGELTGAGIYGEFFGAAQESACHLEVQRTYGAPGEDDQLHRWLDRGELVITDADRDWCNLVTTTVTRGVTVARVRVVDVPHTAYFRWLLAACEPNIQSGEQIRWLPRALADRPPTDDYWLIDRRVVAFNTVTASGQAAGLAVTDDPQIVEVCVQAWDRLWAAGIDHIDYRTSEYAQA